MKKSGASHGQSASKPSRKIAELEDWRNPQQNAHAHQEAAGRRRVEVDGALRFGRTTASSALANPTRGRVTFSERASEGSARLFNSNSRRKRTPRDRHTKEEVDESASRRWFIGVRPQQFWQVETCEEEV
jgi:hypothetical protein